MPVVHLIQDNPTPALLLAEDIKKKIKNFQNNNNNNRGSEHQDSLEFGYDLKGSPIPLFCFSVSLLWLGRDSRVRLWYSSLGLASGCKLRVEDWIANYSWEVIGTG